MTRTFADIDALLAADKFLFGSPDWEEDGRRAVFQAAVCDTGGAVIAGLILHASATIETRPQRGDVVLSLDAVPVQRMAIRPAKSHVNPDRHPIPVSLRRRRLPEERTRIYAWADNRVWPRTGNAILAGTPLGAEPSSFAAAVETFLEACRISAYLAAPTWRPALDFSR